MRLPNINTRIQRTSAQQMQIQGINLTEDYNPGQMESSHGISANKYPYITTADQIRQIETGIPDGYQPISMFAWEKLFVVSDEPSAKGGYKCYYGSKYCGDVPTLDGPKQYAVVNSKLVIWPDKVYFNLYDNTEQSYSLTTAPLLAKVISGTVTYRKAVTS